jgi:FkbM family methyltransferase
MVVRYPSKANMLRFLRRAGVPVGTIIDVGAQEETLELRQVFPDLRHILFEPASEFHEALRTNYAGMDYVLAPVALSDQDGTGCLRKLAPDGKKIIQANLVDGSGDGPLETVTTTRLDSFMKNRSDSKPYLLKLDVDGLEMAIMRGSEGIWDDVSCVIVEATADSLVERMNFLLSKGFKLFDIVDQCYYYDMFSQVDLVFVAEKLMENPHLRPWQTEKFTWKQWVPVASFERVVQQSAATKEFARRTRQKLGYEWCWNFLTRLRAVRRYPIMRRGQ